MPMTMVISSIQSLTDHGQANNLTEKTPSSLNVAQLNEGRKNGMN